MAQSMAEVLLEQGIEQGIQKGIEQGIEQGSRQTTIENIMEVLKVRFPDADINALIPILETIGDLNRLKHLNLNASIAESFRAFQEHLET